MKDQAEHVMLVDLARNDINRVCDPQTTQVETFMQVEKFSHVMHLTSRITGQLRDGKTRFDALRSIFPAGTVSGAPKIRAIELVSELEGEKRGVYAGAVGRIDFADREMDVCIAIRTMTFKDGYAYLQAGGGIVYDSVEEDEYVETINKLALTSGVLLRLRSIILLSRSEGVDGECSSSHTDRFRMEGARLCSEGRCRELQSENDGC